jgi:hypothetical protein
MPAPRSPSPPFSPRVWLKNGALHATFGRREIVLRGWPELKGSEIRFRSERTLDERLPVIPEVDLRRGILLPQRCSEPGPADRWCHWAAQSPRPEVWHARQTIKSFFENVPPPVRAAVEPFRFRQWALLLLARRCPAAVKLIVERPALAFLMVEDPEWMGGRDWRTGNKLREIVDGPIERLAKLLQLPQPEILVPLLDRMSARDCSRTAMLVLKNAVEDGRCARFADFPRISVALVRLPANVLENSSPEFLAEMAAAGTSQDSGAVWGYLWMILRMDGRESVDRVGFHSIAELRGRYEELARKAPPRQLGYI